MHTGNVIDTLTNERAGILNERSRIAAEIGRLQSEQSSLSDRLFHLEKLLISYGSDIQPTVPQEITKTSTQDEPNRPSLLPQFGGLSVIEAIGQVMAEQPEEAFRHNPLVDLLFVPDLSSGQRTAAKRSVSAELSRGAKEGRWYKLPRTRGQYRFNKGDIDSSQPLEYRMPKELQRSQFKNMSYISICSQVLSQHPKGMSLEGLVAEVFAPGTDVEREKAQASLAVELNRAAREKRLDRAGNLDLYFLPVGKTDKHEFARATAKCYD